MALLLSIQGIGSSSAAIVLPRIDLLSNTLLMALLLIPFWGVMLVIGRVEWTRHRRRLESVPIRIHVNGSRGKTGTCRLIGAALLANGMRVVTKTTGKMPAIIDIFGIEHQIREMENDGFPEGNIREQMKAVEFAAKQGARGFVTECMALSPENQSISEEKFIRATIGVITNIRHDHLDIIGPDIVTAARNLCRMIPKNQVVVTAEERLLPVIRHEAAKRGAYVVKVDPNTVPDSIVNEFPFVTFKENIAIALKVSQLLGLDRDKSLRGMLESKPDYGTVRVIRRKNIVGQYLFVVALGVNDVDSVTYVLEELVRRGSINQGPRIGLFNSRDDRAERSAEFGRLMAKKISFEKIIATGEYTGAFVRSAVKEGYPKQQIIEMEHAEPRDVLNQADQITPDNGVVVACGNMVTNFGYGLVKILEEENIWSSQLLAIPS